MRDRILNGWKDISHYSECTVRTAQRWERLLSMPVHRPSSRPRRRVVAFTDELDVWILGSASRLGSIRNSELGGMANLGATLLRLQAQTRELSAELSSMKSLLSAPAQDESVETR